MKRVHIEDFSKAIQYFNSAPKKDINDLRSGCVKLSGAKVPFYVATLESGAMHYYISDGLFYALGCDSPDDQIFETVKALDNAVPDKAIAAKKLEKKRQEAKEQEARYEHNRMIQQNIAALLDGVEDFKI